MRLVKGLAVADAARIVAARMNREFESVDDVWRRSGVPTEALVQLAEADAFLPFVKLQRPDALWAIKALRESPTIVRGRRRKGREGHRRAAGTRGRAAADDPTATTSSPITATRG
jgi:DNA polymerase III alpha subunit